ncbi:Uncharacterised protein (plasmid) [Tsukamurella tyrosinosolvens]|uniref:Uncharacterized protein n=1 Tax=Tsukamurella tyrosinosolvens TaxID=57704 RepID=A0A1H4V2A5_TSUTY|nr:hypothetical protein SAMN04489793_3108 [Tsukamurella tyrosinosolvens]VEH90746.1 Uncharacterised protein [Tsukamurella tyrosinosolvens]
MPDLRVSHSDEGLLEVQDEASRAWWTVGPSDILGERAIISGTGRAVSTDGPTGRRILRAVSIFESESAHG